MPFGSTVTITGVTVGGGGGGGKGGGIYMGKDLGVFRNNSTFFGLLKEGKV